MGHFIPQVFTGSALSRSRAEISFPALWQAISRGKVTFGFSRILTQTLTHTGIRVHGTSGTNRASERGFRAHRAENQRKCLPTAYKPQLITRRSLVQVQPPQPNKKAPRIFRGVFVFEIMMEKMIFRIVIRFSEGRQRTTPRRGGSPTNVPSLAAKKGRQNRKSTPLRLLTQKPMKPWFHRFFLFARNRF